MSRRMRGVLVAGSAVVLLVAVAIVLVARSGGSSKPIQLAGQLAPATHVFPAPPRGAVVFAREDRSDVLALGVVDGAAHAITLQASDVGEQGTGVNGLHVSFSVRAGGSEHAATGVACGAGCYRAALTLPAAPSRVHVSVQRATRTTDWDVALPSPWPPKDATALVARATRVWKGLKSLRYVEHLASDTTHAVDSHWQIVAPDRLAYQIAGGSKAVIVGEHRWDKPVGGNWQKSSALRLDQPVPFWVSARDAHVVGSATVAGHAVWRVSFYDPRTPGWFLASIDKRSARTRDVRMFATAHFMHDSYSGFNAANTIIPPTSNN